MKFKNVEEAKIILAEAEAYIKNNTISEDDIYPGAVFAFSHKDGDGERNDTIKMVIIQSDFEKDSFVLGGNCNNPFKLYSNLPLSKKRMLDYLNLCSIKVVKVNVDLTKFPPKVIE